MAPSDLTPIQCCLNRLNAGDPNARADLIAACVGRVRILTRRMLCDFRRLRRYEQSDDVLQLAIIKLQGSLTKIRPETTAQFLGLADRLIQQTLIDLVRKHFGPGGQARRYQTPPTDGPGALNFVAAPASDSDAGALWIAFQEALDALPREERDVAGLHWHLGLTHPETAAQLGVSEKTVRRRWTRARLRLGEKLRPLLGSNF